MATYSGAERALMLRTPLGSDALLVTGVRGHEGLSELFHFELELVAEKDFELPFDQLLGQNAVLTIRPPVGAERHISGVIARISEGDRDERFLHVRLVLAPAVWMLTRRVQSRVFQRRSAPEILEELLAGHNAAFVWLGSFTPREYTVQYQESDFAFACRLMEEEGIYYYFKHSADGHQLVVTDNALTHPQVDGVGVLPFERTAEGRRDTPSISRWEKTQELTSGKWTVRDYTFELPDQDLESSQAAPEEVECGSVRHRLRGGYNDGLEMIAGTGGYARRIDAVGPDGSNHEGDLPGLFTEAERTARVRMEAATSAGLQIEGASDCAAFLPGHAFELGQRGNANGKYFLVRVEHDAGQAAPRSGAEPRPSYQNRFTCRPAALPFRPPCITPRPVLAGPQTAVVVGPADNETYLDRFGRVKVQFHWDRQGKKDARSSCWLRVSQIWAGPRWGGFFWPRIGHEVVVAFEEGNPDRPLIVGSVYNAKNMPPFELPANDLLNGIKSCSAGSDADPLTEFNGVLFYDQQGKEHVEIHSERDETLKTETDKNVRVGQNLLTVVGGLPAVPGSGSGSGAASDAVQTAIDSFKGAVASHLGRALTFVVGEQASHTFGSSSYYVVGQNYHVNINPGGFGGKAGSGAGAALQTGWGALTGQVNLTVGSMDTLNYGPQVQVHRGSLMQHVGPSSAIASALSLVVGGVTIGANIAAAAKPDMSQPVLFDVVAKSVQGLAMAALVGYEARSAWLEEAEFKAKLAALRLEDAQQYTAEAMKFAIDALSEVASSGAGSMLKELVPAVIELATLNAKASMRAAGISLGSGPEDLEGFGDDKTPMVIHTNQLQLTGQYTVDIHSLLNGVTIHGPSVGINSTGRLILGADARVMIVGETGLDCAVGSAMLQLNTIPGGGDGPRPSTVMARAVQEKTGHVSELKLKGDSVKLFVGAYNLPDLAMLAMDSKSILLKAGTNSIEINSATGITCTAGSSKLAITPQGITIDGLSIETHAELAIHQKAGMLNYQIQGILEILAALKKE